MSSKSAKAPVRGIPLAQCRKMLKGSSGMARVTRNASLAARDCVKTFLMELAAECGEYLRQNKRATLKRDDLCYIIKSSYGCYSFRVPIEVVASPNMFPVATISRIYKKYAGKDMRLTKTSALLVAHLASQLVRHVGHKASRVASAGASSKGSQAVTLQSRHVSVAIELMMVR